MVTWWFYRGVNVRLLCPVKIWAYNHCKITIFCFKHLGFYFVFILKKHHVCIHLCALKVMPGTFFSHIKGRQLFPLFTLYLR